MFELAPDGYIVVTANTDLLPVVAYSFENNFRLEGSAQNILVEILSADIKLRLNNISVLPEAMILKRNNHWERYLTGNIYDNRATFEQWPPEGSTSTGGWLETNWTQNAPYKNFCPIDPVTEQRSVVGCPATAMAQIVNYFETVNEMEFTDDEDDYYHSYAGRNYWIDDDSHIHDFLSFPLINQYLDSLRYKFENHLPLNNEEKAAISFACGVAARQVYTSQVSGTFGVNQAMEAYQRFGFEEAVLLDETNPDFYPFLSQNMMDGRPAHLAVVDEGWTMVTDGYNTDEYYHLNFGWGGSYNGWYLLPEEIPYGLTVIEGCVMNIAYPPLPSGENELLNNIPQIEFYPNPVSTHLTIKSETSKNTEFHIYHCTGEILKKGLLSKEGVLDVSDLPGGMYIIRLNEDAETIRFGKFIKY